MAANRGPRRDNHTTICAIAIVGGLVAALIGFGLIGGAIGFIVGGAGLGAAFIGLRGALTGETPRLF